MTRAYTFIACALVLVAQGCAKVEDVTAPKAVPSARLDFDITVTRDGQPLSKADVVDAGDLTATMDYNRPFSLIAVEPESRSLLLNNVPVYSQNGSYATYLEGGILEIPTQILFSAYYPHVQDVSYESGYSVYSIPFDSADTDAGPLISKTVERNVNQLNTLPLEFGHITNDIGFKICDATPVPELQGLIHLKKITAMNVASAGVYVNDLFNSRGNWNYQAYYRDVVVFEGDAPVGVGSSNELFAGQDSLVSHPALCHRFYAIPDDIVMGRQWVEVIFDVDGFTLNGFSYGALKDQVAKFLIYGVLPNNAMVPGKQYTFHLGLDLTSIYQEISFSASVSGWESKIYEDNDDF